ncbi:unnamed protein product [Caenorhabditis auriculariae]|uniref:Uncharacterized protein n=1 Tax=Caenorhabditis auriculariae TaxID=2777116 RepID=A0A8S1H424_9PELO|nr:unnamed protein product [Caenorhabditis auriculariae]
MLRILLNRGILKNGSVIRFLATKAKRPEPKFTQSAAFQGKGRQFGLPNTEIGYESTDSYNNKKIFSALGKNLQILDEIWSTPPHILTANLERRMLREQIKEAEKKGLSTALLKAQLEYVDVKEEALRIQFEQRKDAEEKKKARNRAETREVASAVVSSI